MEIHICVGSSCHLRGSYRIIELMEEKLLKYDLKEKITLKAAFCLGECTEGVTIKINEKTICGVSHNNFNEVFKEHILSKLVGE